MAYTRETIPKSHTEFGGGPGMIDPVLREDRILKPEQQLWEIYATEPAPPSAAHGATDEIRVQRAAEIEEQNDPQTATVERP